MTTKPNAPSAPSAPIGHWPYAQQCAAQSMSCRSASKSATSAFGRSGARYGPSAGGELGALSVSCDPLRAKRWRWY